MDAKMAILEHIVMTPVLRVITVTGVLSTALKIVKRVDTQTAFALVRMDGWESTVPQRVQRDILDWIAENVVADIVQTMNHVTTSVESVQWDARTGILEHAAIILVQKDITAETVPVFVFLTVRRVDTQTDCVLVLLVGWVPTVLLNVTNHMEKTVGMHAVNIV